MNATTSKVKRLSMLIMLLTAPLTAHAIGADGSGGGDAIVCDASNPEASKAFMLDYYEAKRRQFPLKKYTAKQSVREIVNDVLDRMAKVDPERVNNRYRGWATDLIDGIEKAEKSSNRKNDFVQLVDDELADVQDSKELSIPRNCKKVQVAVFIGRFGTPLAVWYKRFAEDSYYTIHYPTYKAMDNIQRAWLVLHEVNYRELFMTYTAMDSRGARYLNGKLFQTDVLSLNEYLDALRQARICFYVAQTKNYSIPIVTHYPGLDWLNTFNLDNNDQVLSAYVAVPPINGEEAYSGANPAFDVRLKIGSWDIVGNGGRLAHYTGSAKNFNGGGASFEKGKLKSVSMYVAFSTKLKGGYTFTAMYALAREEMIPPHWTFLEDRVRIEAPNNKDWSNISVEGFIYLDKPNGKSVKLKKLEIDYDGNILTPIP